MHSDLLYSFLYIKFSSLEIKNGKLFFTNIIKIIAFQTEIFQGMFDTIISFTPSKVLCKFVTDYVFVEIMHLHVNCFVIFLQRYHSWRIRSRAQSLSYTSANSGRRHWPSPFITSSVSSSSQCISFWLLLINPNHPKPVKLQQLGLLYFDGLVLYSPDRDTLHGAGCPNSI